MSERRALDEAAVERALGRLLRIGVLVSALLVAVGAGIVLWHHGADPAEFGRFHGEPRQLRHIPDIVRRALEGRGHGLIQLGLLALIATPVMRVAFAALAFRRAGDRLYFAIGLWVLGVLLGSLLLS